MSERLAEQGRTEESNLSPVNSLEERGSGRDFLRRASDGFAHSLVAIGTGGLFLAITKPEVWDYIMRTPSIIQTALGTAFLTSILHGFMGRDK